jgi:UDP:flavonoid glycosyltransferase YjiC (YdhE family)
VVKKQVSMKPRLLFFPFPLLSHYTRCLALAGELRDDFEILFQEHKKFSMLVDASGFETFPCINFDAEVVMDHAKRFDFGWMKTDILEEIFLAHSAAIQKFKPQAVVGDASFTLKMAAEKTGTKMIAIINGYMSRHYSLTRKITRTHPAYPYSKSFLQNYLMHLLAQWRLLHFVRYMYPSANFERNTT